jgi:hypothetical protein
MATWVLRQESLAHSGKFAALASMVRYDRMSRGMSKSEPVFFLMYICAAIWRPSMLRVGK